MMTAPMKLDEMKPLRTNRLLIRPWTRADLPDAWSLWGDPEVMALIDSRGALNPHEVEEKLANEIACQEQFGVQYWKTVDCETGAVVGCCGLRPTDLDGVNVFEIGVHILRS